MKLALVTTPPSVRSAIGEYTQALVRELAKLCDVELFVQRGREGESFEGRATRSADTLLPRDFDQVLYQLGNERGHAFMLPMLRALGGTVALHDWVLFDLALAAYPALERGGLRGCALALREGGFEQARTYLAQRADLSKLGEKRSMLPLNRSVVRFGDAFIVHDEQVRRSILEERNAPTPTGVVPHGADQPWSTVAAKYFELLSAFPPPRTARMSLIRLSLARRLSERRSQSSR
jgi:hypothetical protein